MIMEEHFAYLKRIKSHLFFCANMLKTNDW